MPKRAVRLRLEAQPDHGDAEPHELAGGDGCPPPVEQPGLGQVVATVPGMPEGNVDIGALLASHGSQASWREPRDL
jgi:hypothetical protein